MMRHEKLLHRGDGSTVKLVAEYMSSPIGRSSIQYYALVKFENSGNWQLFTPHHSVDKSLGGLSVDEYVKRGRKGLLSVVRPAEILKAGIELNRKLRILN